MTTHVMAPSPNIATGGGRRDAWSLFEWIRTMIVKLDSSIVWHRRYRETAGSLSELGDHELNDIGIARCDIPRIAFEAANGAQKHAHHQ